jgi:DNA-binding transcriptional ArsR family regulator
MDFTRPVRAVIPGAQGRILAVLAETTAELNVRTIARLSGVSLAQASRVLPALVDLGLIERREAPPSALFRFVPEHIAARAITALTTVRQTVLDELACTAAILIPLPISVIVFGSFARGDADAESDLDVIMVRSGDVDEDDALWRSAAETWRQNAQRLTGNRVEVIEVDEQEVRRLLHSGQPLWTDVQADGIVVFGTGLAELTAGRIA